MTRRLPSLFIAELRRYVRLRWSYRLNIVSWVILWLVAFPLLMSTFDAVAGGYAMERRQASFIGFLLWDWSMALLAAIVGSVSAEARDGTLESFLLSPVSPLLLFLLRAAAALLILGIQTLVMGMVLAFLLQIPLDLGRTALFIALLTVIGAGGVGLALAGLALAHKSVDSVVGLFTLLALVLTGAIVPLNDLGAFYEIWKYFVPTTWGIDAIRAASVGDVAWATLAGLTLQTVAFVVAGGLVFVLFLDRARVRGDLAAY